MFYPETLCDFRLRHTALTDLLGKPLLNFF